MRGHAEPINTNHCAGSDDWPHLGFTAQCDSPPADADD